MTGKMREYVDAQLNEMSFKIYGILAQFRLQLPEPFNPNTVKNFIEGKFNEEYEALEVRYQLGYEEDLGKTRIDSLLGKLYDDGLRFFVSKIEVQNAH